VRNIIITAITPNYPLTVVTRPTPIQHKAFALLGVPVSPIAQPSSNGLRRQFKPLRLFHPGSSG
jgi:hypothetical protein